MEGDLTMQQNLKIMELYKGMGKRYLMFVLIGMLLLTLMAQDVNATEFYQYTYPQNDSHTTTIYGYVVYPFDERVVKEQVSDGSLYEFTLKYDLYPAYWNNQSSNLLQYCQINITTQRYYSLLSGDSPTPITQQLYKRILDTNLYNQEYYISLSRGDTAYYKIDCYFTNSSLQSLTIPATIQVATPTYDCIQCAKYEWSKIQNTLIKSDFLQQSNVNNIEYIKKLISLNFEFAVIIYWFILILVVVFAVGLIFLGVYWFYMWLMKVTK